MALEEDGTGKHFTKTTDSINVKEKKTFLYLHIYIYMFVLSYPISFILGSLLG